MAITKTYINGSADALTSFLDGSGLFHSVTLSSGTITCKDANDNTVLTLSGANNGLTVTAYYQNGVNSSTIEYSQNGKISYAYSCTNGVMLQIVSWQNTEFATLLLTKTNNDEVAVIYSSSTSGSGASIYTPYQAICLSDVSPVSAFSISVNTRNQTVIVPFVTNNDLGVSSYTPNAGYISVGQYYNMGYGKITIDDSLYLTNGYWAIKD